MINFDATVTNRLANLFYVMSKVTFEMVYNRNGGVAGVLSFIMTLIIEKLTTKKHQGSCVCWWRKKRSLAKKSNLIKTLKHVKVVEISAVCV